MSNICIKEVWKVFLQNIYLWDIVLFLLIFLLNTPIHELGHLIAIKKVFKKEQFTNVRGDVKIKYAYPSAGRTESDVFKYLSDNRESPNIQKYIKYIAKAGYQYQLIFLMILSGILLICVCLTPTPLYLSLSTTIVLLMFILLDICTNKQDKAKGRGETKDEAKEEALDIGWRWC